MTHSKAYRKNSSGNFDELLTLIVLMRDRRWKRQIILGYFCIQKENLRYEKSILNFSKMLFQFTILVAEEKHRQLSLIGGGLALLFPKV